jgi:hypothetical protein
MVAKINTARWADREQTTVVVDIEGSPVVVRAVVGLSLYDQIVGEGVAIAAYQPTAVDVRAEAQRRVVQLMRAQDFNSCIVKQLNATMRATELTNKLATGGKLTPAEAAEAAQLQALVDAIKVIRACSNVMEPNPPLDFASDGKWAKAPAPASGVK